MEVPDEVYRSLDAFGQDEKWWEAVELQKLILAHNNIEVLKEDLRNLTMLAVLNVSRNNLSRLPVAIGELQLLKSMDVSSNMIVELPDEIRSATSLVKYAIYIAFCENVASHRLECSNNRLCSLPVSLACCTNLSELKASNNSLSSLPEELSNCSKMTKLDVEGNKLEKLSDIVFASCTMLTELNAGISSIPSTIKGCTSLMEFYLGNNALASLPPEIGTLNQLGTFDMQSNQLKEFPVEACSLRLSFLNLSNNSLSGLPSEMGLMTTLKKLLLSGNPLRTLRSSRVHGPTPALLKYLRSRVPNSEDSASPKAVKQDAMTSAAQSSMFRRSSSCRG